MSYILNALRKSERERQAIEPDTVTRRIAIHHSQPDKSSTKLIAALIVINLSILVYFLGFSQKTAPVDKQIEQPVVKPELSHAETAAPSAKIRPRADIENRPAVSTLVNKTPIAKTAPIKPVKPVIAPPKPAEIVAAKTVKPEVAAPKKDINPSVEATAVIKPVMQPNKAAQDNLEKTAPSLPKNDVPYLEDLPREVSRSVPTLAINVFSYSSMPAERFVMIDMVKYVPGQRIKDQLELKEIREDSIVVSYDNRTFKIRRP